MKHIPDYGKFTLAGLAGVGLGALAMYLFDPVSGRRRRSRRGCCTGHAESTERQYQRETRDGRDELTSPHGVSSC